MKNELTQLLGIEVPLLCGAMYPCSNPELVAAVSEAGAMGIVQPISLNFVHGKGLREGLKKIRALTQKPIGFNAIVEKSSSAYEARMREWVDVALEEGVRFFVTALGNPSWVVREVEKVGGVVFHDVTTRRWAERAKDSGVHGFICVNNRAGGHAGTLAPQQLFDEVAALRLPVVCAGGIGSPAEFREALAMGYSGAQVGTRFIATQECSAHEDYKRAILRATAADIVLTEKISGVPVSVIRTPYIDRIGTKAGPIARRLLRHPKAKHWMRTFYTVQSLFQLKSASQRGASYKDYWQAGKSVEHITEILPAAEVVRSFSAALDT